MKALSCPIVRFVLLLAFLVTTTDVAFAQKKKNAANDDCKLQLDEAKQWYEEGELERIEEIEKCVNDPKSMSREKRIEGLQLLTESYLYTDRIGKADKTFRSLLKVDPLYDADSTDPEISHDLIYLSRTFSRTPIFSMYFGAGANYSMIEKLQNYGTDNTSGTADHESYAREIVVGATGSIGFEMQVWKKFDIALDLTFGYRTYSFGDSLYSSVNVANPTGGVGSELISKAGAPVLYSILTFKENQFWFDLPLMVRYNLGNWKMVMPYIYAGAAANFLLYANLGDVKRTTIREATGVGGDLVEQIKIDLTAHPNGYTGGTTTVPSLRTTVNVSFVAGAGIKIRVGRNFIFADFRYTRMFLNSVDINNRYANPDLLYRYSHVDNDYRMDNFAFTVGFIKSFYTPRKKQQFNPLIISTKYDKWLEKKRNAVKKETDEDLKRELNSTIKDMERQKPSLIEDVQKGKSKGDKMLSQQQKEFDKIQNKNVKVEVKYE